MRKKLLLFIFGVFFSTVLFSTITQPTNGQTFKIGTKVSFTWVENIYNDEPREWIFPDGNVNVIGQPTPITVTRVINTAGSYTARFRYYDYWDASDKIETVTINILENRTITYAPYNPYAGQIITFTANNFNTPGNIKWDMGDGTILSVDKPVYRKGVSILGGSAVQYTYNTPGSYTIRAYDQNGTEKIPITLQILIAQPNRQIVYSPETNIRVDQPVYFGVTGFLTNVIDWNFGDGTVMPGENITIMHRFQTPGTWIVTAKDSAISHTPVQKQILILPENRSIIVSAPEVRLSDPVQVTALNFRGDLLLWDWGDGTRISAGHSVTHIYGKDGTYTIKAIDENGESLKEFTTTVRVRGISDEVNLEIAEIKLDNGKYYKVVPRNSKNIKAVLRMKMRGTGSVSGYWLVDGNVFEYFTGLAVQGELKKIYTNTIPGLPTLDPGLHTVSVKLTRPAEVPITFPVLKYFVLSTETIMETIAPKDGFVVKEKDIPSFSWKEPKGGSKYKIGFSNYLYPLLMNEKSVTWVDTGSALSFKPSNEIWDKIKRNKWTHWKVRAFDTNMQFIAESEIHEIKVVIATAEISLNTITDLDGNKVKITNGIVRSNQKNLLVDGTITYKGDSKFIVLRVYSGEELIDQLLFRDVKKDEIRNFKSSIPNLKDNTKIKFEVLKTSSPSVIIGIKGLILRKG